MTKRKSLVLQLGVCGLLLAVGYYFRTELSEALFSAIEEEQTVFALGYSREAWKQVRDGDTVERVTSLLGEPLKKYVNADGATYLYSTQGPKDTSYRMRTIIFGSDGRVLKKEQGFYFD